MSRELTKNDKFFLMLALLDTIEVYNLEAMTGVHPEIKQAVTNAINASRRLTRLMEKKMQPIECEFAIIADEFQEMIEELYLNKT